MKCQRIVNARLAENLIPYGADTAQISTDGAIASQAIDGNAGTPSCTTAGYEKPWWVVDLGSEEDVGTVVITFPDDNSGGERNYYRSCFIQLIIHERVNSL